MVSAGFGAAVCVVNHYLYFSTTASYIECKCGDSSWTLEHHVPHLTGTPKLVKFMVNYLHHLLR